MKIFILLELLDLRFFQDGKQGKCGHTRKILFVIGTICPDEFGRVTGHPPAPYEKGSGLIITTSPLPLL